MLLESKKIHLIEEVLKVNDNSVLSKLESVLRKKILLPGILQVYSVMKMPG
jgi:hypothetical protein